VIQHFKKACKNYDFKTWVILHRLKYLHFKLHKNPLETEFLGSKVLAKNKSDRCKVRSETLFIIISFDVDYSATLF
jgi:hypothetical protein